MVSKILYAVDGTLPPEEAVTVVHGLLSKTSEIVILQVVPQLPHAWTAWPAFPDPGEDLAKASDYVGEVSQGLLARGWNVVTKIHFSPLSAAEVDQEILRLAATLRPDLICLAMERGSEKGNIVREALVPVLVARSPSDADATKGLRKRHSMRREPVAAHRMLLLKPAGALIFREAGIL
jgi:nucleotide-binding universal stress UspA family protein